ncbi:phenylalanine--tRNA ligase beta subunit-related protein [Mesorhizobium sp. M0028]|uniref:B3/B4 domain-containing protein n=1 Tax=Mesorhizobium sp. M0028 TaxID=2956849 RepID=UPI00333CE58E
MNDTIAAAEQAALRYDAQRDARPAAWAVAYEAFGTKANRTPCSAAALLKRVRKDGSLPRISPLVDAYNAVSVLYGVPIGGEDLDLYQGVPRLLIARGAEPFDTIEQGEMATEHPEPGEVIWCDDAGVTCRRWNWRQGRRTMVTVDTRAMWLVLEALGPMSAKQMTATGEHLMGLIQALCPGCANRNRADRRVHYISCPLGHGPPFGETPHSALSGSGAPCSLRWPTQLIANDPERLSKTSVERNQITVCSPLALFGVLLSRCLQWGWSKLRKLGRVIAEKLNVD